MKVTKLIKELQDIVNKYGDTDVYVWDESSMKHTPVTKVYFPVAEDFVMGLKDDKEYVDDFNMILESAVIL